MGNSLQPLRIVIFATLLFNGACTPKSETATSASNQEAATMDHTSSSKENPYLELRSTALNMPASQFGINDNTELEVYGFVMDWNVGRGVATFAAFKSGDASMYTSSGGGIIGGIGHDNVKLAAQTLVRKSKDYLEKAKQSDDISLAADGTVKCFFLTTKGRLVSEERLENFDNGSSQWLGLFVEANKLITELRAIDDMN